MSSPMQAMQCVFLNSSCVVSGGQPGGDDAIGPDRQERFLADLEDGDRLARREIAHVAVADERVEELVGERARDLRHLLAAIRPVHVGRIAGRVLRAGDGDHRFGRGRAAADDEHRVADVLVGDREREREPGDVARNVEAARHAAAEREHDVARLDDLLLLQVVVPRHDLPDIAVALEAGHLDADLRRHAELAIERLPLHAHLVLVDGRELQPADQLAALRELHPIAAAVVGKNRLVLGVVADALHQVVVVDDQRRSAELFQPERSGCAERTAADDQRIEHFGELDRRVEHDRPVWPCFKGR